MPKKKDEDEEFTKDQHSDFMATVAASRAAQDAAAKRLEDAYTQHIKQAKEKVAKLKQLEDQHNQNESDLIEARKRLAEQDATIKALKGEKKTLADTLKQVRDDAQRREDEDRRKIEEARAAISERDVLAADNRRLKEEVARLDAKATAADKEAVKHQVDAERARGEVRALQERVSGLQLELETLRKLAASQGPAEDADTIKRLSEQLNQATSKLSEAEAKRLEAERAKIEGDAELKYKTAKVADLEAEVKRLKAEVADLRTQLDATHQLHASSPAPSAHNTSVLSESTILDLTQRKDDAQQQLVVAREELARMQAENGYLREQLAEAKKEPIKVKSRALGDLDGDDDGDDARARMQRELLEAVRKQVSLAETELDAGLADLAAKDEEWAALHRRIRVADSKIAGFTEQVRSLSEDKANHEAERAALKDEVEKLREEVARLTARAGHEEARRAEIEALADERAREITRLHELLKARSEHVVTPAPTPVVVEPRGEPAEAAPSEPSEPVEAAEAELDDDVEEVDIEIVDDDDEEEVVDLDFGDEDDDAEYYYVDDDDFDDDDDDSESGEWAYAYRDYREAPPRVRSQQPLQQRYRQQPVAYYADRGAVSLPGVVLRPSQAATRLGLVGSGTLRISREGVAFAKGGETVRWPLRVIKKYGDDARLFSIEVGSIAATGKGVFFFETDRWLEAFRALNNQMIAVSREFASAR